MTFEELSLLSREANKANVSLLGYLRRGLKQRHNSDKTPRCLRCGACRIKHKKESIYSDFCDYCKTKLADSCE